MSESQGQAPDEQSVTDELKPRKKIWRESDPPGGTPSEKCERESKMILEQDASSSRIPITGPITDRQGTEFRTQEQEHDPHESTITRVPMQ
jgi:hypothetical protein